LEPVTFLKYFKGQKHFAGLAKKLAVPPGEKIHLHGIIGSAKTILTANLYQKLNQNMVLLLNDREEAAYFYDDLNNLGFGEFTLFFPSSYKRSIQYGLPEQENIVQRTETLNNLRDAETTNIVVTYPEALVETVISQTNLELNTLQVATGDKISIEFINEFLYEYGFERVDFVYEPGQFAVRGSIVDVFSYSNEDPYRLDFFGDEVESLRSFNIDNQISKETFQRITIIPNIQNEKLEGSRVSLFEFLPQNTLYFGDNLNQCFYLVNDIHRQTILAKAEEENLPERIVTGDTLKKQLQPKTVCDWGTDLCFEPDSVFKFSNARQPVFNKNFDLLGENLEEHQNNGYEVFILSNQEKQTERLQAIFHDIKSTVHFEPVNFTLHEGFVDHDLEICCYTDHQIFERYHRFKLKTRKAQREAISMKELNMLHPGDYVVHIDHGIGKFAGLVRTEINGKMQEAIHLVYKNNDSLLNPL